MFEGNEHLECMCAQAALAAEVAGGKAAQAAAARLRSDLGTMQQELAQATTELDAERSQGEESRVTWCLFWGFG